VNLQFRIEFSPDLSDYFITIGVTGEKDNWKDNYVDRFVLTFSKKKVLYLPFIPRFPIK